MSEKLFYICNIIAEKEEDYNTLLEHLGKYPVHISKNLQETNCFDMPTLMVGWEFVKHRYSSQNIMDTNIVNKLSWSFSKSEDEKKFYEQAESFFITAMKEWLPKSFKLHDSYLHKDSIEDFFENNINSDKKVFIYFHEGAMYINNDGNNFIVNIKSLAANRKDFRQVITNVINKFDIVTFSYHNFGSYVNLDETKDVLTIDGLHWVKFGVETLETYFNVIPNFKVEKYIPFLMSKLNPIYLDSDELVFYKRMCQRDKITHWLSNREIAFSNGFENNKLDFKIRKNCKLSKINYSDKRTITGRIASRDGYNPQNLDKDNGDRKNIISRFDDGRVLVYDYISFETKISLYLSGDDEYIEQYHNSDLHLKTADILFKSEEITREQRSFAKSINHTLLYGAGEIKLLDRLSQYFKNPEEKLYNVRMFLKPIIEKSDEIKKSYKDNGYLISPWGYIIKADKQFAGFSHYIQTYASEILVDKLIEIKEFLKPYKTQFMFQVHDSLIFDLHPEEKFLVEKIARILSYHKKMIFGVAPRMGRNYQDLNEVFNIISE